ncbi:CoA ester lyase [SAR92 clade bacterium H921]|nr:CoA ester lyase [SAR92 clade bacterium H921]
MNEFRSALFIPGGNAKMLAKASSMSADLIIFDLEDSVLESEKSQARKLVQAALTNRTAGQQSLAVRVNAMDTPHLHEDLVAVMSARPDIIMLPKLDDGDQLTQLSNLLDQQEAIHGVVRGNTKVIAITAETPAGIFGFDTISNSTNRLVALTWGPEDLATELGASANRDCEGKFLPPFELARSLCLAKARQLGVQALDTVFADIRNVQGLQTECSSARSLGYTGKLAIHPSQIEPINQTFSPTQDEISKAKKLVELFAANPGVGALRFDNQMVDIPHLKLAQRLLTRLDH